MGLKSNSLGAGSAALLFLFLPLAELLHARPQGERVVLSVGKIIFIILQVEPLNIKHAPGVCFCLLIPFHFLLARHNTFIRIRVRIFYLRSVNYLKISITLRPVLALAEK